MRRAIGIIRVSQVHGRNGDKFMSPDIQRERIERDCERYGLYLIDVVEELDVSGGKPLRERPRLADALAAVENGDAEAIVFAYRDRVDRSMETASELCQRMDAADALLIAGGQQITHRTVADWQNATLGSFLSEHQRRVLGERMHDVQVRAIERGVAPFPLPPGYRRREDGVAERDDKAAALYVCHAFYMRASGRSVPVIRRYLADNGITLSDSQVRRVLRNRFYLGEVHYGKLEPNLHAHEPLVDRELFDRVQAFAGAPRGSLGRSERLLARLGVLRCGSCDSRLSVSKRRAGEFMYRCTDTECPARVSISAPMIENLVADRVVELCEELLGRANGDSHVQQAKAKLDGTQAKVDQLVRLAMSAGQEVYDEPAMAEAYGLAVADRDAAKTAHGQALAYAQAIDISVNARYVFEHGSLEGKRELIAAVVERVTVAKGRGPERVKVEGKVQ